MGSSEEWDGKTDRRANSAFEREVIKFMARIDEHMSAQTKRCDSHAKDIVDCQIDVTSLKETREYAKGALKTIAIGAPAVGSITWFILELVKNVKHMKGG